MRPSFRPVLLTSLVVTVLVSASNAGTRVEVPQSSPPRSVDGPCDRSVDGALGDGHADATSAIQSGLDALGPGGTLCIERGTYMVDAVRSLLVPAHVRVSLADDAVLEAAATSRPQYSVLTIKEVEDVVIQGGQIRGDRDAHLGTGGEWGMGITVNGARNVMIRRVRISECWGDGIYVGRGDSHVASENVHIEHVELSHNRRQGLSIIAGRNVVVSDASVADTQGTFPAAAVDIEPNAPDEPLEGIRIERLRSDRNGFGLLVSLHKRDAQSVTDVEITGHVDTDSAVGFAIMAPREVTGRIVVTGADWTRSRAPTGLKYGCGLRLQVSETVPAITAKHCG